MTNPDKLFTSQVSLTPLDPESSGELSDIIFRKCFFCEQSYQTSDEDAFLIQKLSGPGNFYCPFCLRHNLNTKNNRDILILSFRSIIGYFYFQNYLHSTDSVDRKKLWISEIEDYISAHEQAGLVNPLFLYEPNSMLWFVDFSRVGKSKKKVPLDEVIKTVVEILAAFDLKRLFPSFNMNELFLKYKNAIQSFYSSRHRPENRKILIPTLTGCGLLDPKSFTFDETRNFIFEDLQLK